MKRFLLPAMLLLALPAFSYGMQDLINKEKAIQQKTMLNKTIASLQIVSGKEFPQNSQNSVANETARDVANRLIKHLNVINVNGTTFIMADSVEINVTKNGSCSISAKNCFYTIKPDPKMPDKFVVYFDNYLKAVPSAEVAKILAN